MTLHHCFQLAPAFCMGFAKYQLSGFQNLPPKSVDKQNDRIKKLQMTRNQTIWTSKIVFEKKSQLRVKKKGSSIETVFAVKFSSGSDVVFWSCLQRDWILNVLSIVWFQMHQFFLKIYASRNHLVELYLW